MSRGLLSCSAVLLLVAPAWAANFHARMLLKDASNGDRRVGASPKQGIPQGHTLKIAIEAARFGRAMADGAEVDVEVRKGGAVVANKEGALDETGYGEFLVTVDDKWTGQHHIEARVTAAEGKKRGRRRGGQLEKEFRVIEGEPAPDIPGALPVVVLVLGAAMLVLWLKRPQRATV
ncbi:MAG: hypothetical protein ACYTFI_02180 [Planctomycetota bacterium]